MATRVGSKNWEKERNKFFKKNGGEGFEYHGWWYFHGIEHKIKDMFVVKESKTNQKKPS